MKDRRRRKRRTGKPATEQQDNQQKTEIKAKTEKTKEVHEETPSVKSINFIIISYHIIFLIPNPHIEPHIDIKAETTSTVVTPKIASAPTPISASASTTDLPVSSEPAKKARRKTKHEKEMEEKEKLTGNVVGGQEKKTNEIEKKKPQPKIEKEAEKVAEDVEDEEEEEEDNEGASTSAYTFDDDRTIFVGRLNKKATEDDIKGFFTQIGAISRIRVLMFKNSGRPQGAAFIEFESPISARKVFSFSSFSSFAFSSFSSFVVCSFLFSFLNSYTLGTQM